MTAERRKHFIRDWIIVRGYDLRTLAKKAGLSVKTVVRIRDGEASYPKSMSALCAALGISLEEAYISPYDLLRHKHLASSPEPARDRPARPPRALDLDDLPAILVNNDGRPLNPLQKEALLSFIEAIKKMKS